LLEIGGLGMIAHVRASRAPACLSWLMIVGVGVGCAGRSNDDIGVTKTAEPVVSSPFSAGQAEGLDPDAVVEELLVALRNDCPRSIEIVIGPDPLYDGAPRRTLEAGAEVEQAMRAGEHVWLFPEEGSGGYSRASVERQGGTIVFIGGELCNGVSVTEGHGARLVATGAAGDGADAGPDPDHDLDEREDDATDSELY